jgi:hypothetical protein
MNNLRAHAKVYNPCHTCSERSTIFQWHFRSRTSLISSAFFLCHCALMISALVVWFVYATSIVDESAFASRWVLWRKFESQNILDPCRYTFYKLNYFAICAGSMRMMPTRLRPAAIFSLSVTSPLSTTRPPSHSRGPCPPRPLCRTLAGRAVGAYLVTTARPGCTQRVI